MFGRVILEGFDLFLSLSECLHVYDAILIGWIVLHPPRVLADIAWRLCLRPVVGVIEVGSHPFINFLHPAIISLVHLPYLLLLDVIERPMKLPLLLL